jgi:enterochelin esterase-like enzyme
MTIAPRPPTRLLPLLTVALTLTACTGLNLTPEPLPTLFVLPTLTPVPATSTPQPILDPDAELSPPPSSAPAASVPAPACDEEEGQVVEGTYPSAIADQDVSYRIYLPPCYETSGRRYPVLYMLHGLGQGMNYTQWDDMGLDEAADAGYRRGALPPIIIVMPNGAVFLPDGSVVHGMDYFSPKNSYEYMILTELMPVIEAMYCTWNEREGRAIGGLSRGGFWAFEIALRHPELFSAVGGHSAAFYEDSDLPAANNPLDLARDAEGIDDLRMYLDHGVGDYDWVEEAVELFSSRLDARGIEHTYVVNPVGSHNEDYWASHTADYLSFYTAEWPTDINLLPPCNQPDG